MHTLFENKYKCTEEVYQEIYKYLYFHNNLTYGIVVFYAAWLVLVNYFSLTTGKGLKLTSLLSLALIFFFLMLYSKTAAKRRYKDDLSSNKWIPTTTSFLVREDAFVVKHSNAAANPIPYSEIKTVVNTKNFIILTTNEKLGLYVKKDSFTKGTTEEFIAFLKEKGFKIK